MVTLPDGKKGILLSLKAKKLAVQIQFFFSLKFESHFKSLFYYFASAAAKVIYSRVEDC